MDPTRIIHVQDYSPATLRAVVVQLEGSTSVDHLIYRESELDALWSLLELELRSAQQHGSDTHQVHQLQRLCDAAKAAHDCVAAEDPAAAAIRLRQVVEM